MNYKQELLNKNYCVNILSRPNGLVTLTLSYGLDYDHEKSFNCKLGVNCTQDAEIASLMQAHEWVLNQPKVPDLSDLIIKL